MIIIKVDKSLSIQRKKNDHKNSLWQSYRNEHNQLDFKIYLQTKSLAAI